MSFVKRKYGQYPGFEIPPSISGHSLKKLQAVIGAGLFTKIKNDQDSTQEPDQKTSDDTQADSEEN
jgi:hypothetical protein